MIPFKFKYQFRFLEFWKNIKTFPFSSRLFLVWAVGWIINFYSILFAYNSIFPIWVLLLCITCFFWFKFSRELITRLNPPSEIIFLLLLLFYLLHYGWSFLFMNEEPTLAVLPGGILLLIQILWLINLLTLFSLILTQNSKNQIWFIIFYLFLGFIGLQVLRLNEPTYWYFFQFILFLLLFRKTSWAESLTQIECWLSLVILVIFYLNLHTLPDLYFSELEVKSLSWYFLPKMVSHFLKLYLLAILVKIPFVLIYHHAALHRKLQIAGWLQSSIPQFIQLFLLLLLFYFFIAAWQAENLKKTIIQLLETANTRQGKSQLTIHQVDLKYSTRETQIPGFETITLPEDLPASAVLELKKVNNPDQIEFFACYQSLLQDDSYFTFVKIDTFFLAALKKNFVNISANGLITYPFTLESWDSVFYKIRGWVSEEKPQGLKVFPFGLTPHTFPGIHSIRLTDTGEKQSQRLKQGTVKIMNQNVFTAGRVYTRLLDHNFKRIGYWNFETVIVLDIPFFKSPVMRQFLFWLFIYALINIFIIQRVIKFGNRINQIILQKFNLLTQGIRQISSGNLDHKISMEGEDEFVELAERFNSMGSELQKKISEVREKDRLEYELRIAREVQISLLPQTLPQIPGYQLSARMNTATEVGGDFYDVLQLDGHNYLFVIGDVSGKGTSAAFYMAQCISLIRFSRQFSHDPREILIRLNRYFSDPMIDKQIFVTAVIGLLDHQKNQMILLRAGHNRPMLIPADTTLAVAEIKMPGLGIGLERKGDIFEKTLKSKLIHLAKGDTLFFYSDGLVDAYSDGQSAEVPSGKADFYGDEHLINLLRTLRGKNPSEIQERVTSELAAFYGNSPLIDDMTMLILQRTKE
ncbi:MAG: hypothetical protein A2Y94_13395 [Caldithrix sp. RBG_13_44_9]|nr:MAG: hypothetical protein A2Y94_13395 [Caldithrix sp. RBG_13_44_9]